jgi:hypothetical protein
MIWILLLLVGVTMSLGNAWRLTGSFLFALVASVVGRGPWRESLGAGAIPGVLLWAEFGLL